MNTKGCNHMKIIAVFLSLVSMAGSCAAYDVPPMPEAAKEIGCPNCHAIDHKVVGPAWMDVSKRYRDMRDSPMVFNALVKKVSNGGSGNWGDVPMIGNDPASIRHKKIEELVVFVLSLSDLLPENSHK